MPEPRMQTNIVGRRTVAYSTYERAKSEAAVYKAATEALEAEAEKQAQAFDSEAERSKCCLTVEGLTQAERQTIHGERLAYEAAARHLRGEKIIDQAARERREAEALGDGEKGE